MIWTANKEGLLNFIQEINQVHRRIFGKFHQFPRHNGLYNNISNNRLFTKVYKKLTDRLLYLHKHSYHPENLKRNIPYGQALRLRKMCTNDSKYHEALQKSSSSNSFQKQAYTKENLIQQFTKASLKTRSDILKYKQKYTTQKIPLLTTFHRQLPDYKQIIEKH